MQGKDEEMLVMKKDFFQGSRLQQSSRLAETKQEDLPGSCSQITTACFLLLSHWFYLYRGKNALQSNTHTSTHSHRWIARNAFHSSFCTCCSLLFTVPWFLAPQWRKLWVPVGSVSERCRLNLLVNDFFYADIQISMPRPKNIEDRLGIDDFAWSVTVS